MAVFSFHLAKPSVLTTAQALLDPPRKERISGLRHVECMAVMQLGAPILSPARMQLSRLAVFASWDDEAALDAFLRNNRLGPSLAAGWHVRLEFLRRWGRIAELDGLPESVGAPAPQAPVVAVTLARLNASAMAERQRQDFHHEFTTLRFRALSEHGPWEGQENIVPPG